MIGIEAAFQPFVPADTESKFVIAGLDPAIHEAAPTTVRLSSLRGLMDARVKPGHDGRESREPSRNLYAPRTRSITAIASLGASLPRQATWVSGRTRTSFAS